MIGSKPAMADQAPPAGISEEEWSVTPVAVRVLVKGLLQRVAQLEVRLNQTSRNSSKPPSSDPPRARPRPAKEPTGRKAGGQPGHEGHGRKLKPESEVDQLIDVRPEHCGHCGVLLLGDDPAPERHQVTELPRVAPVVTEYRRHCLRCVACGARTQAAWPTTMPTGSFGPRLQATVGYLTGRIGASQREVHEIIAALYQADVSVGSIGILEQAVNAALAAPVAEVEQYVQRQPVRNADETSWREKGQMFRCFRELRDPTPVPGTEHERHRGAPGLSAPTSELDVLAFRHPLVRPHQKDVDGTIREYTGICKDRC